ncbi:MAG: hypothetical protein LBR24_02040 [Methanobrevibacter sp.]|jgi:hypothetical protein|nr:hypothetical protein [Methanobrevibacter sp.]
MNFKRLLILLIFIVGVFGVMNTASADNSYTWNMKANAHYESIIYDFPYSSGTLDYVYICKELWHRGFCKEPKKVWLWGVGAYKITIDMTGKTGDTTIKYNDLWWTNTYNIHVRE